MSWKEGAYSWWEATAAPDFGTVPCQEIGVEAFFPPNDRPSTNYELELIRETCGGCPVKRECGEYAINAPVPDGIWGGLMPSQRHNIRKQRELGRIVEWWK